MAVDKPGLKTLGQADVEIYSEVSSSIIVSSTAANKERFPDLETIQSVILKSGPRVRKEASYIVIMNRHTGEFHHDAITIKTFRKRQGEWYEDLEHSVSLDSESEDEIQKLLNFLAAARSKSIPKESGDFVVVAAPRDEADRAALQKLLNDLSATGKIDVLASVLSDVKHDVSLLPVLLERVAKHPQLFAEAAAALNLATYKAAVEELRGLIDSKRKIRESDFQRILTENPWMFGSEYSELLHRRNLTRDEQQDFVVRRTTDGYIELIEIKTPLEGKDLFNFDASHKSFFAGVELSKVVGQVQNYIEKLDQDRNSILVKDHEDTAKIRAKIIIGCNGDESQQQALRRFNGHLHRIEVITFHQLLKIAQRVLDYLESALRPNPQFSGIPIGED